MAFSFQGCGTAHIGKMDFHADGSYRTTEWITFFWLPIFPLRTRRVIVLSAAANAMGSAQELKIVEETRPNLRQCVYVYSFVAFVALWLISWFKMGNDFARVIGEKAFGIVFLPILALPAAVPFLFRQVARTRATKR